MALLLTKEVQTLLETNYHIDTDIENADDNLRYQIIGNLLMAYDLTWHIESIPILIGKHKQIGHNHATISGPRDLSKDLISKNNANEPRSSTSISKATILQMKSWLNRVGVGYLLPPGTSLADKKKFLRLIQTIMEKTPEKNLKANIRTISQKQNRINVKNNQMTRCLSTGDAPKLNVTSSSATSVKGVFKRIRTLQGSRASRSPVNGPPHTAQNRNDNDVPPKNIIPTGCRQLPRTPAKITFLNYAGTEDSSSQVVNNIDPQCNGTKHSNAIVPNINALVSSLPLTPNSNINQTVDPVINRRLQEPADKEIGEDAPFRNEGCSQKLTKKHQMNSTCGTISTLPGELSSMFGNNQKTDQTCVELIEEISLNVIPSGNQLPRTPSSKKDSNLNLTDIVLETEVAKETTNMVKIEPNSSSKKQFGGREIEHYDGTALEQFTIIIDATNTMTDINQSTLDNNEQEHKHSEPPTNQPDLINDDNDCNKTQDFLKIQLESSKQQHRSSRSKQESFNLTKAIKNSSICSNPKIDVQKNDRVYGDLFKEHTEKHSFDYNIHEKKNRENKKIIASLGGNGGHQDESINALCMKDDMSRVEVGTSAQTRKLTRTSRKERNQDKTINEKSSPKNIVNVNTIKKKASKMNADLKSTDSVDECHLSLVENSECHNQGKEKFARIRMRNEQDKVDEYTTSNKSKSYENSLNSHKNKSQDNTAPRTVDDVISNTGKQNKPETVKQIKGKYKRKIYVAKNIPQNYPDTEKIIPTAATQKAEMSNSKPISGKIASDVPLVSKRFRLKNSKAKDSPMTELIKNSLDNKSMHQYTNKSIQTKSGSTNSTADCHTECIRDAKDSETQDMSVQCLSTVNQNSISVDSNTVETSLRRSNRVRNNTSRIENNRAGKENPSSVDKKQSIEFVKPNPKTTNKYKNRSSSGVSIPTTCEDLSSMKTVKVPETENNCRVKRVTDMLYSTPSKGVEKSKHRGRPKGARIEDDIVTEKKTCISESGPRKKSTKSISSKHSNTVITDEISTAIFNPVTDDLYKTPGKQRKTTKGRRI